MKSLCELRTNRLRLAIKATANSTYPKGGVSCSKDSFVVNQTLVFQIKFCGKSPALRVAAKRYGQGYETPQRKRTDKRTTIKSGWNKFTMETSDHSKSGATLQSHISRKTQNEKK
jgi:hypothetical protein